MGWTVRPVPASHALCVCRAMCTSSRSLLSPFRQLALTDVSCAGSGYSTAVWPWWFALLALLARGLDLNSRARRRSTSDSSEVATWLHQLFVSPQLNMFLCIASQFGENPFHFINVIKKGVKNKGGFLFSLISLQTKVCLWVWLDGCVLLQLYLRLVKQSSV